MTLIDECIPVLTADAARDALIQVVRDVFRTMLGIEIGVAAVRWNAGPDSITATIDFTGAWRGALWLQCSKRPGRHLAQLFVGEEERGVCVEEVQDVIGELANIIAGNLDQTLPRGTQRGLPSIARGQYSSGSPDEHLMAIETAFVVGNDIVSLTFMQDEN